MPYAAEQVSNSPSPRNQRKRGPSVTVFLAVWILLIGAGVAATVMYSNHMKKQMVEELDAKWQSQISHMQSDYQSRLKTLDGEVAELQTKVQAFNELLTFTKDNASNKTDNSNQLYTQLNEVKKQLSELQKKMDLLK
ncbi:hypothetical protein AWM70_02975 [Paenibacillus yonginensis]|uniref:Uncharacterized protein n=1 Tax=Paenibacillus yonginensis TaxID=1462996 RepID=A0A1B1MWY7_9BACL|nr:hypothetical protein [Paenibacillus yonginensis]ANS73669.1 hypothetical protein AWM70_02975 [Paenibacillus yonginensis]